MTQILEPGLLGSMLGQSAVGATGGPYSQRVLRTATANLIAYWPLNETSGTNADNAEGTAARDGTYNSDVSSWPVATGIGDGNTAPTFDGTNDHVDVYSASLNTAFDNDEGTLACWVKVPDWTATGYIALLSNAGFTEYVALVQDAADNQINWQYRIDGVTENVSKTSVTETGWFHMAVTWSVVGGSMIAYYDGSAEGAPQALASTWQATDLGSTRTVIGARLTSNVSNFTGNVAHVAVWDTPLSAYEISLLASV